MKAWYTDGTTKIAISEGGKVHICDDCPCGGCDSWGTSFFVNYSSSSFTGTITPSTHADVVAAKPNFTGYYASKSTGYCWWFGVSNESAGVHFVLTVEEADDVGSSFLIEILGNFAPPFGSGAYSGGGTGLPTGDYDGGEFVIS